jgi:hypothetical protein
LKVLASLLLSICQINGNTILQITVSEFYHGLHRSRQAGPTVEQVMTSMEELKRRKIPLNLAVVHTDPDAFIANLMGWLEITAFISAQRAGEAQVPPDGATPKLSPEHGRARMVAQDPG